MPRVVSTNPRRTKPFTVHLGTTNVEFDRCPDRADVLMADCADEEAAILLRFPEAYAYDEAPASVPAIPPVLDGPTIKTDPATDSQTPPSSQATGDNLLALSIDDLRQYYRDVLGAEPHHAAKAPKLIADITDAKAAKTSGDGSSA